MAKTSMIIKAARRKRAVMHRLALGLRPKPGQAVKLVNRCHKCGKEGGYIRQFDLCRICFREMARQGQIMGLRKSSW